MTVDSTVVPGLLLLAAELLALAAVGYVIARVALRRLTIYWHWPRAWSSDRRSGASSSTFSYTCCRGWSERWPAGPSCSRAAPRWPGASRPRSGCHPAPLSHLPVRPSPYSRSRGRQLVGTADEAIHFGLSACSRRRMAISSTTNPSIHYGAARIAHGCRSRHHDSYRNPRRLYLDWLRLS